MELLVPYGSFEIYHIANLMHFYSLLTINYDTVFLMIIEDYFGFKTLQIVHAEMLSTCVFCLVGHKLIEVFDEDIVLFLSLCD